LHKLVGSIEDIDICNSNILPLSHILLCGGKTGWIGSFH